MTDMLPSATGERAAMGGYVPQYDEFSRRVYDHILQGDLVEIRVADAEENVGKLDDICYVTTDDVYGYQVKWTITDADFTFSSFQKLVAQAVDGWRKLQQLYPDKTVHAILLTNKECKGTNSVRNSQNVIIGSFVDYADEVVGHLCNDQPVDAKWQDALDDLKVVSTLTDDEWRVFWPTFRLETGYIVEDVKVENSLIDKRQDDILMINRFIQQAVADKNRKAVFTIDNIINALGWQGRMTTRFNHSLTVPMASYEPIGRAIDALNTQLEDKEKGYIFLQGTPGSGKSTILTQWAKSIPNKTIRYYAFDFTKPSSSKNNDWHRGDSTSFLFDMVHELERESKNNNKRVLPFDDEGQLKKRFYELLEEIGEISIKANLPTVIIVDGLDHITREYTECTHTLIKVLPSLTDLPNGIVFVLGSQYFDKLLPRGGELLREYTLGHSTIVMSPFTKGEAGELVKKILGDAVTNDVLQACYSKSQGHPLYLRYILNILKNSPSIDINAIPPYEGNVETYYDRLLSDVVVGNAGLKHLLALISRVNGEIELGFVKEWNIDEQVQMDFRRLLFHLFDKDSRSHTIRFFHNSFKQYLLNKTSTNNLTGDYDEQLGVNYYKELANYVANSKVVNKWDEGYYLYNAHEYDEFIRKLTPDVLTRQIHDFRPLWHAVKDVNYGLAIARDRKDPYLIVRYLLMRYQITQMGNQNYSSLNVVPYLLKEGDIGLAKFQIHAGRDLICSQYAALEFARNFIDIGDIDEANILIDLGYPEFIGNDPRERVDGYNRVGGMEELAEKWIETAAFLLPYQKVQEHYNKFADYLQQYSDYHDDGYDENTFYCGAVIAYTRTLITQHRFVELESLIHSLDLSRGDAPYVAFGCYTRAIKEILSSGRDEDRLDAYYGSMIKLCPKDSSICNLQVALISYRMEKAETSRQYLDSVDWNKLDDYHMPSIEDKFGLLRDRILYVDLATALGCNLNLSKLIPNDDKDVDSPLLNTYVKMVLHLAVLRGKAKRGTSSGAELLSLAKPYLSFCDKIPFNSRNRYANAITYQRADFYKYLVSVVEHYDSGVIDSFVDIITDYFNDELCRANSRSKRMLVVELVNIGADKGKCFTLLNDIEAVMLDNQDVDGAASELFEQGKAWMAVGETKHAMDLFHRMIAETFGVGYRKDYQPTTFVKWIANANKAMPTQALDRIRWMTQRLRHIYGASENPAGREATGKLLEESFNINIGYGIRLAQWLLDKELTSYLYAFGTVIECLLERVSTEEEYLTLLSVYTDIYLFTDSPTDPSPYVLRKYLHLGKKICPDKLDDIKQRLRNAIMTNCPENNRDDMLDVLEEKEAKEEKPRSELKNGKFISEAEKLLTNGKRDLAWDKAMEAIKESSFSGWVEFYDGGTRFYASKMLQKVDKDKGREYTIKLFVNDIMSGNVYGLLEYLDELLPLFSDKTDESLLFPEEFGYINRILREDAVCEGDTPDFEPNDMNVMDAVIDWCVYLSNLPIFSIVEQAMILLATLVDKGHVEIVDRLSSPKKKLEIGMYLIELHSNKLIYIRPIAEDNVFADNYLLRIYARKILDAIGIPYKLHQYRRPSPVYKMIFPKSKENLMMTPWHIDTKDPNSVMRYANIITEYLSEFSSISQETLNHRGYMLLLNHIDIELVSDEAEKRFHNHLKAIYLKYLYPQHRAMLAIDAMMEVAAELIDGSPSPIGRYDDSVFMMYDFANIHIKTISKPTFIQRIAKKDMFYVHKDWTEHPEECVRLNGNIEMIDEERVVIAEHTRLIKTQDKPIVEEYLSTMSLISEEVDKADFFDDTLFQRETYYYYKDEIVYDRNAVVVRRSGYFYMYTLKETWIAFNPFIAKQLGWRHSDKGMFAWEDEKGNVMAQSFYWRSGNVQRCRNPNSEMGEGWIVAISIDAYSLIQKIGYTYLHQMVERQNENEDNTESHSTYKITKL